MAHDWIFDVLADLKSYARQNGLAALAEQLDEVSLLAACEIASQVKGAPETADTGIHGNKVGSLYRAYATGQIL